MTYVAPKRRCIHGRTERQVCAKCNAAALPPCGHDPDRTAAYIDAAARREAEIARLRAALDAVTSNGSTAGIWYTPDCGHMHLSVTATISTVCPDALAIVNPEAKP